MKDLPRIAVKAKSWTEMKPVVDLLRSIGNTVERRKDAETDVSDSMILENDNSNNHFEYVNWEYSTSKVYQMPQDWNKIQEALGVEVCMPKDGDVYHSSCDSINMTFRFKSVRSEREERSDYLAYSMIGDGQLLNAPRFNRGLCAKDTDRMMRKATPEEEAKLIEAEHANGYYFDGKELVEIPEYIECTRSDEDNDLAIAKFTVGNVYKIQNSFIDCNTLFVNLKDDNCNNWNLPNPIKGIWFDSKPSTKEEFETQEAKKSATLSTEDLLKVSEAFKLETSKLRSRLMKKSNRINELKEENERLKKTIDNIVKTAIKGINIIE